MNLSFSGLVEWASTEGANLLFIAGIIFCIIIAFRRHIVGAIGTFVILLIAFIFVKNPEALGQLSEFFAGKMGLGK